MRLCKKTFLFLVGVVTISIDEINKAIDEAVEAVDKKSEKAKQSSSENNK